LGFKIYVLFSLISLTGMALQAQPPQVPEARETAIPPDERPQTEADTEIEYAGCTSRLRCK
jgi:hypothetical protein